MQHVHAEAVRHQRHQNEQRENFKQNGVNDTQQQSMDDSLPAKSSRPL
jgi:hypothetical protein